MCLRSVALDQIHVCRAAEYRVYMLVWKAIVPHLMTVVEFSHRVPLVPKWRQERKNAIQYVL